MRLDTGSLGTFYEMAREGAGLAGERLTRLRGDRTRVGVTRVEFTRPETLRASMAGPDRIGVRVPLEGGIDGVTLVLFDRHSALTIAEDLLADVSLDRADTDDTDLAESAIAEASQILASGFVDGWADVLDAEITMQPPTLVAGQDAETYLSDVESAGDLVVVFHSRVQAVAGELEFEHYLIPDQATVERLVGSETGFEFEKLVGFDAMARRGAQTISKNLSTMTGIDMTVDIRRVNFVSLEAIPDGVPRRPAVSVAFSFEGVFDGFLLFLYDYESARTLVEAALNVDADTETDGPPTEAATGFSDLEIDAINEHSNIMASGLLDGWANLLDDTIDHSTPAFAYDLGPATVDPLVVGLGDEQEFAFVIDTRIQAIDATFDFDVDIYAVPDEDDLKTALEALDPDEVAETPTTADFSVREADRADLDDVDEVEGMDL